MSSWLDALPQDASAPNGLLAGPLVRLATPKHVYIWVAAAGPMDVTGRVYGAKNKFLGEGASKTMRFGDHLHVALVEILPTTVKAFPLDELLFYDLIITIKTTGGVQISALADYSPADKKQVPDDGGSAFTYPGSPLPSFYLASKAPIRFLHGSCRKLHGEGGDDALALADDLLKNRNLASGRPSVLFLTGDQIYADEVAEPLAVPIVNLAIWLFGKEEILPTLVGPLPLHTKLGGAWLPFFAKVFRPDEPTDRRKSSARNHAAGFGEFAALYLLGLSTILWPPKLQSSNTNDSALQALASLYRDIPKVRRALANIATYMIFDDHEVTDDWNLDTDINKSTMSFHFGRRVVANALAAYTIFQGWGNNPEGMNNLVNDIQKGLQGDRDTLDSTLLGFSAWSYIAPTSPQVIVLDTRTQRDFTDAKQSAGLLNDKALNTFAQNLSSISSPTTGQPVVIVSATPVFGSANIQDRQLQLAELNHSYRYMYDVEFWAANPKSFAALLDVFINEANQRIVILSGDLHYGFVNKTWLQSSRGQAQIVQFTSSALKNNVEFALRVFLKLIDRRSWLVTARKPNADIYLTLPRSLFFRLPKEDTLLQRITIDFVPFVQNNTQIVEEHNLGELVLLDQGSQQYRLYTPSRGIGSPFDTRIDNFGNAPALEPTSPTQEASTIGASPISPITSIASPTLNTINNEQG